MCDGTTRNTMRGGMRWGLVFSLLTLSLVGILALAGCSLLGDGSHRPGVTDDSYKSTDEVSVITINRFEGYVASSDADGLVAAFSDRAREGDPDLQAKAERLMELAGGGTVSDEDFDMSNGSVGTHRIYVCAMCTVTSPDGSKWLVHVTNCTYNTEDPSELGFKTIEFVPYAEELPHGFGWISALASTDYYGIRLIETWDGYDPQTDW
jgi:hypothetical protein